MTAYYNENDPQAAAWLRELVRVGRLPSGDVDERSIEDVRPDDLAGYRQCHFFAGIGGWAYALRLAGWPDDRPVWTGSPPCQPFSSAGRRGGYDDSRHLAPAWLDLVRKCRPPVLFGEQVASAATNSKHPWLDDLQDHLEAEGYATGAVVLPACGVGAPHPRQRLWIVAERAGDSIEPRLEGHGGDGDRSDEPGRDQPAADRPATETGGDGGLADTDCSERKREQDKQSAGVQSQMYGATQSGERLSDNCAGLRGSPNTPNRQWSASDWLHCRDDKWRPVEPGTFPLADGVSARVGRLRGYGNAIVPQVAAEVIGAYMESEA